MFNPGISGVDFRSTAVALGAVVALTFSHAASAGPLPPSPFVLAPPVQTAPRPQSLPSQEQGVVSQLPARLQRQVVSYASREAPGPIIIDTPNTYLYLVLGHGQAVRYGIGVGRDGFTWSGVQSITRKSEWPDWIPPAEMIARQPARCSRDVSRRYRLSYTRHQCPRHHRHPCFVGLYPPDQRGCCRPLFARQR